MSANSTNLRKLDDVCLITLPEHSRDDGCVIVAEGHVHVPFSIARMFVLRAPAGARRGNHAHKLCTQFFLCVGGVVDVVCDDGCEQRTLTLERDNKALIVPPTIWNTVVFREAHSAVVVLCDRVYEAHDYLHDYSEFLAFRKSKQL